MTHIPSIDLATEIGTQVPALTLGTNLFASTVKSSGIGIPTNGVFVWSGGGPPPQRTMGDPDEIRKAVVHVRVRDSKYTDGEALARLIMDNLRGDDIATYLDQTTALGDIRSMGQDPNGNHYFGMEYIMTYIAE